MGLKIFLCLFLIVVGTAGRRLFSGEQVPRFDDAPELQKPRFEEKLKPRDGKFIKQLLLMEGGGEWDLDIHSTRAYNTKRVKKGGRFAGALLSINSDRHDSS